MVRLYEDSCISTRGHSGGPVIIPHPVALVLGRAAEDLVQSRWVLGDRVFPRGPAPGALEHCRGPVRSAGVPLGPPRYVLAYVFGGFEHIEEHMLPTKGNDASAKEGTQPGESGESR